MKSINKRIKDEGLKVIYLYDKESVNGYPTKDSIVLTYVIEDFHKERKDELSRYGIGVALKVPNDEPIQRIGKAIAYRNLHTKPYMIKSISELALLFETDDYFEFIGQKLNKEYKERMFDMFRVMFTYEFMYDVEF